MTDSAQEHEAASFANIERLESSNHGPFFADQYGRTLLLRGINVSGASKLPSGPDAPLCIDPYDKAFWSKSFTFVGRPFPAEEAKEHWLRLKAWGLTMIRFVIVWEAIEPNEPDEYDEAYLTYVTDVLQQASDLGLLILIDMHQDCWSRFTGGSGAPLWTLEVAGLDANLEKMHATGAALLQQPKHESYAEPGTLWATNYTKFAVNHMFTLFFAGEVFAPNFKVGNEAVGLYLRRHFVQAVSVLAERLAQIQGVVGFDVMNEPHAGFIGLASLDKFNEDVHLHLGDVPSGIQSMMLADGHAVKVPYFTKSWPIPTRQSSTRLVNSDKVRVWKEGTKDVWRDHGVWSLTNDKPEYDSAYFTKFPVGHARQGQVIDFVQDMYKPFLEQVDQAIKIALPRAFTFIEPVPNIRNKGLLDALPERTCFAPHWYDLQALFEKRWSRHVTMNVQQLAQGSRNLLAHTYFGKRQAADNYTKQYAWLFQDAPEDVPRLIGETGIPFDMNHHYQKKRGSYRSQADMLDVMCSAMERNLLSYTLWNYTPENRSFRGGGDLWNGECFSVYCEADRAGSGLYDGARAKEGWIRPHAFKVAGKPLQAEYCADQGLYKLSYEAAEAKDPMSRLTEIFVPKYLRIERIKASPRAQCRITTNLDTQTVTIQHEGVGCIEIEIEFARKLALPFKLIGLSILAAAAATAYSRLIF